MVAQRIEQGPAEMAPVEEHALSIREQRVLLNNISWELFRRIVAEDEARRVPRLAYNDGALELMTPSRRHESITRTLQALVDRLADAWDLELVDTGSATLQDTLLQKGVEPDSAHFIQHATEAFRDKSSPFPGRFPPDLIVEVEISHALVERLPIFAAMEVPEIWHATTEGIAILTLQTGRYERASVSLAFPLLTEAKLAEFLALERVLTRREWSKAVKAWAADVAAQQ
ncbi:MAG: Uma2 family endonuclease [Chloroflexota bacterium]|nr:Uma2 family endonuclease [Chloroflexota bacterium]